MATSSLGRLTLDLAVRLSEFTEGMSRAERETAERTQNMQASVTSFREHLANELGGTQVGEIFSTLNERFGSLEGGIGRVGGALAGMAVGGIAIGLGALSKMAIEAANADAQMAMLANRANISVQHFQVLAGAAKGLGYEQEQLADVFADLQEKLGEFSATQGGGAADFFDALRNNTKMTDDQIKEFGKTLQGKDGVEAVQLIKDKMDELGATSQEQRFVFESLASDLTNLLPLFEDGGKLLGQYGEALQEAGVIKTQAAIEQSQLLAAQTQAVQMRFNGFKSQLAGTMMPVLSSLAQHFFDSGKNASGFGSVIQGVGIIAKGVGAVILTFSTVVGFLGDTIGAYMAQLANFGRTAWNVLTADGLTAKAQALRDGFANAGELGSAWLDSTVNRWVAADKTMSNMINNQIAKQDGLTGAILAGNKAQLQKTAGLKIDTKTADENAKAHDKAAKAVTDHAKAIAAGTLLAKTGDTGIGRAHVDIRYAEGDARRGTEMRQEHLARFLANGRPLTSYTKTSGFGYRNISVAGASKYHLGNDYATPVGTNITTTVPVKSVKTSQSEKGGYISTITFEDGVKVSLLHLHPSSAQIAKSLVATAKSTKTSTQKITPLEVNKTVRDHAAKYGYADLEKQYGLPVGLLSAVSMTESGGNPSLTSKRGAKGEFQFMPDTAARFGVAGQERNTAKAAVAAAKYLQYLLNTFGSVDKAIMAYNAGEGSMKSGKALNFTETKNYLQRVKARLAYMQGGEDGSVNFNDILAKTGEEAQRAEEELQRQREQDNKDRLSLTQYYATEAEKIESVHADKIAEINRLSTKGLIDGVALTAEENKRYEDELFFYQIESKLKYAEGEEKITLEHQKKLRQIAIDYRGKSEDDFKVLVEKANEQYLIDLENYRWAQVEKLRAQKALIDKINDEMSASSMQTVNDYLDLSMKSSLSPEKYAQWSMQRDYNNQYSTLFGEYQNRQDQINEKDDRGNFKIESETERNALLETARQEHLAKLLAMETEHTAKVQELDKQMNDAKMQQTATAFGVMTSAMSAFFGQQSIAYKLAANAEKGYALYQAWLNSKKAVLAAYADTPGSVWAKMGAAGKAAIDTGLMTAAIQAISPRGFSSGGYTGNYGVNDIAGVVHGQEFVLNAMATKRIGVDSLNALNRGDSIGGHNISVNVVVNSDGSGSVDSNAQMGKQMGDAIKAAVLKTLMQEKRQGGLLAR